MIHNRLVRRLFIALMLLVSAGLVWMLLGLLLRQEPVTLRYKALPSFSEDQYMLPPLLKKEGEAP
jgi:hypothetical protein